MNNTRPASCKLCNDNLQPGQAVLWSYHEPCPPGYLCARCSKIAFAYRKQVRRAAPNLAAVRRWIAENIPAAPVMRLQLGQVVYYDQAAVCQEQLNATMQAMGLAGPFLPTPLLSYLTHLEGGLDLDQFNRHLSIVSEAVTNHIQSRLPNIRTSYHERLNQTKNN